MCIVCARAHMCTCKHVCSHALACVYVHMCSHACTCVFVCVFVYVCVRVWKERTKTKFITVVYGKYGFMSILTGSVLAR